MRVTTGIHGLDLILRGGFIPSRSYLISGQPGAGKTTLGLHFLAASQPGSRGLLITFAQPQDQLRVDASSLGLNIGNVEILDLNPSPEAFSEMQTYDIFSPAEIEREPITREMSRMIEETNADRIFVDDFDHFRELTADAFHRRRLVKSFFRFATARGATLVVASDDHDCARDVDGVIQLEFTQEARNIRVTKFRGSDFHAGPHAMRLTGQGFEVLPNVA